MGIIANHLGVYSLNASDYMDLTKKDLESLYYRSLDQLLIYNDKEKLTVKDKYSIKYIIREINIIGTILFNNCEDDVK